jgi:hypothetical protein
MCGVISQITGHVYNVTFFFGLFVRDLSVRSENRTPRKIRNKEDTVEKWKMKGGEIKEDGASLPFHRLGAVKTHREC